MTLPSVDSTRSNGNLALIHEYYTLFNERRFADAAALFADDAVLEQVPMQCRERGGAAYLVFAETWTQAFPDAAVSIQRVAERPGDVYETELFATGTHTGDLTIGGCIFRPTGVKAALHLRELLQVSGGRISMSCLSFDFQELAHQLSRVDDAALLIALARIRALEDQLRATVAESPRRRDLLQRIGHELDAARRVLRPYFAP